MRKRINLADSSVVIVQTIDDTMIEVQVVTAHSGSCLLYPQGREEAIAVADAILAAVRAQDEAQGYNEEGEVRADDDRTPSPPTLLDWAPAEGITLHPTNGPMLSGTPFLLAWIAGYNLPEPVATRCWVAEAYPALTTAQLDTAMAYFVAHELQFTALDEVPHG